MAPELTGTNESSGAAPAWSLRLLWMGLAACASTLLLAVTNFLTQDVAAIPFLWIVPISVVSRTSERRERDPGANYCRLR